MAVEGPENLTAAQVADEFSRAAKILVRRFDERLREHGVSTPRSRLLVVVYRSRTIRLTELALAVGIAQGTASTLVEALVGDGLMERRVNTDDRRAVLLQVTEEGADLARTWTRDYDRAADELFQPLARKDWPLLVKMLRTLSAELPPPRASPRP